jgi:putative MATE family efflux protein
MLRRSDLLTPSLWKYKADGFLTRHFSGETLDYRQIVAIILPILLDQAFLVSMNVVNAVMISSSGMAAISAVNVIDTLNLFLVSIFIAVATGGSVVVAQYKGRQNEAMVPKAVAGSITVVFLLAASLSLILLIFHEPVLTFLFRDASPEVIEHARIYMIGSCLSYSGIAVMEAVCGSLRGIGETRSSLLLSVIMNTTYVVSNLILIQGFHMGVTGLAVSVNIARYFAAFCAMFFLISRNRTLHFKAQDLVRFDRSMLKRTMKIGFPFASEQMFFNGGKMLTQTFIVTLGTLAMATNAICSSIAALYMIPANALSLAVVTVVGQCVGRRDMDQARKLVRSFLILTSVTFLVMAIVLVPFFPGLVALFHAPKDIVPNIYLILLIHSLAQIPLWPGSFLMPAALRAGGDSKFTSVMSMLSMWLFRVVLGYILGIMLPFGIVGFWVAMDCEWGVRTLIFRLRFRTNAWYKHKVID